MPKNKNQHYVSRFYLKGFSSKPSGKVIHIYNLKNNAHYVDANTKGECSSDYPYGEDIKIDKSISYMESRTAMIIGKMISNGNGPKYGSSDYRILVRYIISQYMRTMSTEKDMRNMLSKGAQSAISAGGEDLRDVINNMTDERVRKMNWNTYIHLFILALDLKMVVIENKTPVDFITSDNPVIRYNQYCDSKYMKALSFSSVGFQLFWPISPSKMIVLYDPEVYSVKDKFLDIKDSKYIHFMNKLQIAHCLRNVYYSSSNMRSVIDKYIKTTPIVEHEDRFEIKDAKSYTVIKGARWINMDVINRHSKLRMGLPFFSIKRHYKEIPMAKRIITHRDNDLATRLDDRLKLKLL